MPFTKEQAVTLINKALGTSYTDFDTINAQLSTAPTPNESLTDILNKITKMFVVDSFTSELLEKWTNAFTNTSDRLEIGALAEIVDTALLAAKDDVITTNTDLLPDLTAIPSQYVKRMARNFAKRIELVVNGSIYERAFTSIQAFNSFINLIMKRVKDSMRKAFYDFVFTDILSTIKNVVTVAPAQATGDNFAVTLTKIYGRIASQTPYTSLFNVMSADGKVIKAADIDNASATDIPVKINTLEMEKSEDKLKFPTLIALTGGSVLQGIQSELSEIFHNEVLSPFSTFKDIVVIQDDIYQGLKTAFGITDLVKDQLFFVLDERTLVILTFLETMKNQMWVKAPGGGMIQNVMSQWNAVSLIPWGNGAVFKFTYAPAANPPLEVKANAKAK